MDQKWITAILPPRCPLSIIVGHDTIFPKSAKLHYMIEAEMARTAPGLLAYRRADGEEERVPLRQDVTTLGRSSSCTIAISHSLVSRLHARIEIQHDRYLLFDAGSANGTFVNSQRLEEAHHLTTGDEIWLGSSDVTLGFTDPEETMAMEGHISTPPLAIDEASHTVAVYGITMPLSPLEYSLLLYLAHNTGAVCTRENCFVTVWGHPYDHATSEYALNACIAKLRRNMRAAAEVSGQPVPVITAVQRVGLRLDTLVVFGPLSQRPAAAKGRGRELQP